jgi:three-Cys-motif partner protein
MSTQQKYYNQGTEKKLSVVQSYLESYLQVLSKWNFETVYVDAFAGSGANHIRESVGALFSESEDADEIREGSALRAVKLKKRFSKYIFIESSSSKLSELQKRIEPLNLEPNSVEFRRGDANLELEKICPYLSKDNVRAVVFLDPFGNQVGWDILEKLALTRHVDLWYLFPSTLGVYRQIGNTNAQMTPEQENSLDRLFGEENDWRSAFISQSTVTDLFGTAEVSQKIADVEDITRFMIVALKKVFEGGVQDKWMPLGRDGAHWYSLIFAMANPSAKAIRIGHDISNHLLTKT